MRGEQWVECGRLCKPRANFQAVLKHDQIIIFGGYSGNGDYPTEIEVFDMKTEHTSILTIQLPCGVEGSSLAWHGEKILLLGGEAYAESLRTVLMVDLVKNTCISLRFKI